MMLVDFVRQAKAYNQYLEDNNIDERAEEEAFKAYYNKGETVRVHQNRKLKDMVIIEDETKR